MRGQSGQLSDGWQYDAHKVGSPRVFLIRHGQSTFNASWDVDRVDPGHIDAPLTDLGHEQVRMVAPTVLDLEVELIVTSPATRALQTTLGLFARSLSRPRIVVEPLARDRFAGDSCDFGRSPDELQRDFPTLDFAHLAEQWWYHESGAHQPLAPESRDAFAERITTLASWLESRVERRILVVGHDGALRLLTGVRMANCQLLEWDGSRPEQNERGAHIGRPLVNG